MGVGNRISKTTRTPAPAEPFRRPTGRASYPRRITLDLDEARYQWLRAAAYEARVPAVILLRTALDVFRRPAVPGRSRRRGPGRAPPPPGFGSSD